MEVDRIYGSRFYDTDSLKMLAEVNYLNSLAKDFFGLWLFGHSWSNLPKTFQFQSPQLSSIKPCMYHWQELEIGWQLETVLSIKMGHIWFCVSLLKLTIFCNVKRGPFSKWFANVPFCGWLASAFSWHKRKKLEEKILRISFNKMRYKSLLSDDVSNFCRLLQCN